MERRGGACCVVSKPAIDTIGKTIALFGPESDRVGEHLAVADRAACLDDLAYGVRVRHAGVQHGELREPGRVGVGVALLGAAAALVGVLAFDVPAAARVDGMTCDCGEPALPHGKPSRLIMRVV